MGGVADQMRRGGDINPAGILGEVRNELLARSARRGAAGIQREIAARRQRRANGRQGRGMNCEIGVVEHRRAEIDLARCAVSDDRDRIEIGQVVRREDIGNLLHAVARGIEHEDKLAGLNAGDQSLDIGGAGIDENDLLRISSQHTRTRHYDTPHLPKADDRPIKGLDFLCLLVSAPQAKHRPRHQRYVEWLMA